MSDNRLRNTILCTLMFAKGKIICLVILEALITLLMISSKSVISEANLFISRDIPIMIFMFTFGMSFYNKHTPFCIANAVSFKYRIVSICIVAGGIIIIAGAYDSISTSLIIGNPPALPIAEFIRYYVHNTPMSAQPLVFITSETILFYMSIFSTGYFVGAIRYIKGDNFALGIMAVMTVLFVGSVILTSFTAINPIALVIGVIPAIMLQSRITGVLFYAALTFVIFFFSCRIDLSKKRTRTEE